MRQNCHSPAVMKHVISMSGSGRRAWRKNPCVATVTSAAYLPASRPNMSRPSAHTANAVATPAAADGSAAVSWVTSPPGQDTSAMSQASSAGLL